MRLEFSEPPSHKRLAFSSQAPEARFGYLQTHRARRASCCAQLREMRLTFMPHQPLAPRDPNRAAAGAVRHARLRHALPTEPSARASWPAAPRGGPSPDRAAQEAEPKAALLALQQAHSRGR
jgi:hypothetical protein